MANIKSAKKRAKQAVERRVRNKARKTSVATAIKKVIAAVERKEDRAVTALLFKDAEAKLSRAKSKGVYHRNTVQRKISRLAKKVSAAYKTA